MSEENNAFKQWWLGFVVENGLVTESEAKHIWNDALEYAANVVEDFECGSDKFGKYRVLRNALMAETIRKEIK